MAIGTFSAFTLKGRYYNHRSDTEKDIELLEREEKRVCSNDCTKGNQAKKCGSIRSGLKENMFYV